jgi:hypothetical protein
VIKHKDIKIVTLLEAVFYKSEKDNTFACPLPNILHTLQNDNIIKDHLVVYVCQCTCVQRDKLERNRDIQLHTKEYKTKQKSAYLALRFLRIGKECSADRQRDFKNYSIDFTTLSQ